MLSVLEMSAGHWAAILSIPIEPASPLGEAGGLGAAGPGAGGLVPGLHDGLGLAGAEGRAKWDWDRKLATPPGLLPSQPSADQGERWAVVLRVILRGERAERSPEASLRASRRRRERFERGH